ncbi:MAG TPA: hypothetical protein VI299_07495 [Polyangiales bacterium]
MELANPVPEEVVSDAALISACRSAQEHALATEGDALLERWRALELGFRAHIERHQRYTASRLQRRDPAAALRVRNRHLTLGAALAKCAVELGAPSQDTRLAAQSLLDQVIEHLGSDPECRFTAPRRRRRDAVPR